MTTIRRDATERDQPESTREAHLKRIRALLGRQSDLPGLLESLLAEGRALTHAEAGSIYVCESNVMRLFIGHNEVLARRLGAEPTKARLSGQPIPLNKCSLAGYVGSTGRSLNVPDAYGIDPKFDYLFDRQFDAANLYRTQSVLAVPLRDAAGRIHGVLQLINARDADHCVVPFSLSNDQLVESLGREVGDLMTAMMSTSPRRPHDQHGAVGANDRAAYERAPSAPAARPKPIVRRLGELVLAHGLIGPGDLESALAEQKRTRERLGSILVRRGLIDEQRLVEFLSRQYGVPAVSPAQLVPDQDLLALVPAEIATKHEVMPVERNGHVLTLAMADPNNFPALDDVAFVTGLQVAPAVAPLSTLRQAIERAYRVAADGVEMSLSADPGPDAIEVIDGDDAESTLDLSELRTSADQAPVVRLVNTVLLDAIRRGASDIHVEPGEKAFKIRFRIDGVLQHVLTRAKRLEPALVSRIKIMANLDIAERRRAQDGGMQLRCDGREVDLRVAILPTVLGEAVSLRILDRTALPADLAQLGFDPAGLAGFERSIRSPYGMILITGPTGSGKTTTLYTAVRALMSPAVKILTIEDPAEYRLEDVTQVEVNEAVGWTFAAALRSFLRHDPDVILVGEMRDLETAQVAVRAALTGHLVCSTLHTNDCPSTIARLVDMGIPNFLVSYAVRAIVAQRLVRKLCTACREPYAIDESVLVPHGYVPTGVGELTVYRARGCERCRFSGTRGRIGLFQVMPCSEEIRRLTMESAGRSAVERVAREQGMRSLREAGFEHVRAGLTTVEEVLRVTAD